MKEFLLAIALLLTVFVFVGSAQKAPDLRENYGPPDVKGRYRVRPNIGLTVEFSADGLASKMVIRRLDSEDSSRIGSETLMSTDVAREILAEVVPATKRGKLLGTSSFALGCSGLKTSEYEQVTITIGTRCEAQGGGAYDAIVHWK
jgi:hypothetical protein